MDKWLGLLATSETTIVKLTALRVLCQFASTPANAQYLVEETQFVQILGSTASLSIADGSIALQRLVLRTANAVALSHASFQDSLLSQTHWLSMLEHWTNSKDDQILSHEATLLLRFASSGALSRALLPHRLDSRTATLIAPEDAAADKIVLSIFQNMVTNSSASREILITCCAAIAVSAQSSHIFCVRLGSSSLLSKLKSVAERNPGNIDLQLNLAEFVRYFTDAGAAAPSTLLNSILVAQGWMQLLNTWAHSGNKDLKLATVHCLRNLVQDDEIAVKVRIFPRWRSFSS